MQKLIDLLKSVQGNVAPEVQNQRLKSSDTLNKSLLAAYPGVKAHKSSKSILLDVWKDLVEKTGDKAPVRRWVRLFKILDQIIEELYALESTRINALTPFRTVIRDKYGADSEIYAKAIINMGITQERAIQKKQEYKESVSTRNENREQLPVIYVEDVLDLISVMKSSDKIYHQFLAVLLATGSRSIEVSKVSSFEEVKGDPHTIQITELAKDDRSTILNRDLVGLTGREVVYLVKRIRDTINVSGDNAAITNRISGPLGKAFRDTVQKLAPNMPMTAHKTRYIYGNAAYILHGEPRKQPYESYIQKQLGHISAESTKSYLAINMELRSSRSALKPTTEMVVESETDTIIKALQKKVEYLEAKIDGCCTVEKGPIDLAQYRNTFTREATAEAKVNRVVDALRDLASKNIKMRQSTLRTNLGYSSAVMTDAYKKFRSRDE